jgi:osomolarity two-component system phosphorelay intermediate protein YPD1
MEVFEQILELDEDDQEFSQSMVKEYLAQAQATIRLMDEILCAGLSLRIIIDVSFAPSAKHELTQLSTHGHFLKGSSAALGVVQVQEICEKIQHLGNRIDPSKPEVNISAEDAFARIRPLLARLKDEQAAAEKWLKEFLGNRDP